MKAPRVTPLEGVSTYALRGIRVRGVENPQSFGIDERRFMEFMSFVNFVRVNESGKEIRPQRTQRAQRITAFLSVLCALCGFSNQKIIERFEFVWENIFII
ncbi:MAG: hypothetical protein Q7J35_04045 [Candidatus Methanoperedens sp.]|nr:hypothetical protein [Candidatus Methanoperedens sp.]